MPRIATREIRLKVTTETWKALQEIRHRTGRTIVTQVNDSILVYLAQYGEKRRKAALEERIIKDAAFVPNEWGEVRRRAGRQRKDAIQPVPKTVPLVGDLGALDESDDEPDQGP